MGRRSRSPGKPDTRGIFPMATAPRLWKYGVQRESANKVPSERVSCPRALCSCMPAKWNQTRVNSWGCRRNGNRGFMVPPWRLTTGVEPDAVKAARPVLNGGDEETCGNVTRLVPTQPGFQARRYGRDAGYPTPPVQTRTCSFPASGSSVALASVQG